MKNAPQIHTRSSQRQTSDTRRPTTQTDAPYSPLVPPPLSLYIHIPWCIRKCPYCDFNSHEPKSALPESDYIAALLEDLEHDLPFVQGRPIQSVFFGGGTPSLFSADSFNYLLSQLNTHFEFSDDCEITLEANPGTFEREKFEGFRQAGINRLSLGVQSFQADKLAQLGRIHDGDEAKRAIHCAMDAGFERLNIDLMHGLPGQSCEDALTDIHTALAFGVTHLSWYQLTIEPNTQFHKHPPRLPVENILADIQHDGFHTLAQNGLAQYEVSAYAQPGQESRHNLNYWRFGDYLALGAGAHGKITHQGLITRYQKTRLPEHYLSRSGSRTAQQSSIASEDLSFEFLMNALRLNEGFQASLYEARTGLPFSGISGALNALIDEGLLERHAGSLRCSALGRRYLDDVVARFLPS